MALRIKNIVLESWADELEIMPGERVISINHNNINDFVDLQFYGADEELVLEIQRLNGELEIFEISDYWAKPLGIIAEDHVCRQCINNCIFCFIDQMPPGQRESLYIKDDDHCFSFYYGNFITLTNLTQRDYDKIIEQHLSPLYISVHTTNPALHRQMLRYNREFDLMERLRFLSDNEVSFHTQIVVVPGYNDGLELIRTLDDLDNLGDNCLSIGIVPVGLTKYRQDLTALQPVTESEARRLLKVSADYTRTWCSDEIYIKAGRKIPASDFYDEYEQLENGIGMIRMMFNVWEDEKQHFLRDIKKITKKLVFISGELAAPFLERIAADINRKLPDMVRVQSIINNYFGEAVTVTGLLTWQDIRAQLHLAKDEMAVFCSNTFNSEGITLDGASQSDIIEELNGQIMIVDEEFMDWEVLTDQDLEE